MCLPKTRPRAPAAVSAATVAVHADFAEDRVSALSQVSGVLGSQWGDEGKGKLVDVLAPRFDIVARCQVRICESVSFLCLPETQLFNVSSMLFKNLVVVKKRINWICTITIIIVRRYIIIFVIL